MARMRGEGLEPSGARGVKRVERDTAPDPMASRTKRFLKGRLMELLHEVQLLYLVVRDERTPRRAKVVAGLVLAYAVSPIDVIPDPIVAGLIDDLVVVPLGLRGVRRLAPSEVVVDAEARVDSGEEDKRWKRFLVLLALVWVASLALMAYVVYRLLAT